jgi:hypothetical protein
MPATSKDTTGDYGAPKQFIELRERYFNVVPEFEEDNSSKDDRSNAYHPTSATASNATSPLTAYSQSGPSIISGPQIETARSHPRSHGYESAESGSGQTVVPRRSTRQARKAPNSRELPDDDRPASPSPKKSTGERTSEGEEEVLSGTSEDEFDGPAARKSSTASRSQGGTVGGRDHLARRAKKGSRHTHCDEKSVWSGRFRSER